ncbi:MAG: hypothetical protein ACOX5X_02090 [Acholeplasmataceae bacterium]|jgi:hypothetical protein
MLILVANFFQGIYDKINGWFKDLIQFDDKVQLFYDTIIAPLPELVKMLGLVFVALLLILGAISFIKKFIKTSIIIGIIILIVVLFVVL